jgi:hypothetical protein
MENEKLSNDNEMIIVYLKQLTPFQIKANDIAKRNLGSSYCIEKSIGFLEFKKNTIENKKN